MIGQQQVMNINHPTVSRHEQKQYRQHVSGFAVRIALDKKGDSQ